MNKPPRFEPVAPLLIADGTQLHESTRTAISTNVEPCGARSMAIATTRMQMHVREGTLEIRFGRQVLNGAARQAGKRRASPLRTRR